MAEGSRSAVDVQPDCSRSWSLHKALLAPRLLQRTPPRLLLNGIYVMRALVSQLLELIFVHPSVPALQRRGGVLLPLAVGPLVPKPQECIDARAKAHHGQRDGVAADVSWGV